MKKVFLFAALAVIPNLTFISCDPDGPTPQPESQRDPNDITGIYSVNYSIYLDDSPLPVFSSFHDPYATGLVQVVKDQGRIGVIFQPNGRAIEFNPFSDENTLHLWSNVYFSGAAGDWSFICPDLIDDGHGGYFPGSSVQTEFVLNTSRPIINSQAEIMTRGTIIARKEYKQSGYDVYGGYGYYRYDGPDIYNDLDMTIELVPFAPNDIFETLTIVITSR